LRHAHGERERERERGREGGREEVRYTQNQNEEGQRTREKDSSKRDLLKRQKRPTKEAKETY
jgi:hypothetical protein